MGKGKSAAPSDEVGGDPLVLAKNYNVLCKAVGIKQNDQVLEMINGEDTPELVAVDAELGPIGVQVLVQALLGAREGLPGPYNLINTIRLWRSNAGEEGARALADLLKKQGKVEAGVVTPNLCYLQLLDCRLNPQACSYLGRALAAGGNRTLLTLNLDHNDQIRGEGARRLAEGLCTNTTLKRLSLAYCEIGPDGGRSVKNLLSGIGGSLEELDLKGNRLTGEGVKAFTKALAKNLSLRALDISNNDIGPNLEALQSLADALAVNRTLVQLRMQENHIGDEGAQVLLDSGALDKKTGNTSLKELQIDIAMSSELFQALMRAGAGGGKKGKKKGGKKKK